MFIEQDSDEDSIATDTTVDEGGNELGRDPDNDGYYIVECIRADHFDEATQKQHYLIKWAGYPLCEASDEPHDNLPHETLQEWSEQKAQLVARGVDLDALFQERYEEYWELKDDQYEKNELMREDKARRRAAKRQRRAAAAAAAARQLSKQKKTATAPLKRKEPEEPDEMSQDDGIPLKRRRRFNIEPPVEPEVGPPVAITKQRKKGTAKKVTKSKKQRTVAPKKGEGQKKTMTDTSSKITPTEDVQTPARGKQKKGPHISIPYEAAPTPSRSASPGADDSVTVSPLEVVQSAEEIVPPSPLRMASAIGRPLDPESIVVATPRAQSLPAPSRDREMPSPEDFVLQSAVPKSFAKAKSTSIQAREQEDDEVVVVMQSPTRTSTTQASPTPMKTKQQPPKSNPAAQPPTLKPLVKPPPMLTPANEAPQQDSTHRITTGNAGKLPSPPLQDPKTQHQPGFAMQLRSKNLTPAPEATESRVEEDVREPIVATQSRITQSDAGTPHTLIQESEHPERQTRSVTKQCQSKPSSSMDVLPSQHENGLQQGDSPQGRNSHNLVEEPSLCSQAIEEPRQYIQVVQMSTDNDIERRPLSFVQQQDSPQLTHLPETTPEAIEAEDSSRHSAHGPQPQQINLSEPPSEAIQAEGLGQHIFHDPPSQPSKTMDTTLSAPLQSDQVSIGNGQSTIPEPTVPTVVPTPASTRLRVGSKKSIFVPQRYPSRSKVNSHPQLAQAEKSHDQSITSDPESGTETVTETLFVSQETPEPGHNHDATEELVVPSIAPTAPQLVVGTAQESSETFRLTLTRRAPVDGRQQQPKVNRHLSNEARFRNLAEQNRVHRHGQREAVPSIDALAFIDPKTGNTDSTDTIATAFSETIAVNTPQDPRLKARSALRSSPQEEPPSALHDLVSDQRSRRSPRQEQSNRSLSCPRVSNARQIEPNEGRGTSNSDNAPSTAPSATPVITKRFPGTTCYYWIRGNCMFEDHLCDFAHYDTGSTGPPSYAVDKKRTTCHYWLKGGCNKPEWECEFAHNDTGNYANDPATLRANTQGSKRGPEVADRYRPGDTYPSPRANQGLRRTEWGSEGRAQPQSTGIVDTTASQTATKTRWRLSLSYEEKKEMTCYFWHNGYCNKSESDCDFAHRETGVIAGPPGKPNLIAEGSVTESGPLRQVAKAGAAQAGLDQTVTSNGLVRTTTSEPQARSRDLQPRKSIGAIIEIWDVRTHPSRMDATLACRNPTHFDQLVHYLGGDKKLVFKQLISAADFQQYILKASTANDPLLHYDVDLARTSEMRLVADICYIHVSGFVAISDSYCALLYPSDVEEWDFLQSQTNEGPRYSLMRLVILRPVKGRVTAHPKADSQNVFSLMGLDADRFAIASYVPFKLARKKVYLFYESHHKEQTVLKSFFRNMNFEVKTWDTPNVFDSFSPDRDKHCLAVFHPDFSFSKIASLQLLISAKTTFWHIGYNERSPNDRRATQKVLSSFMVRRLFPSGELLLITDDLILKSPVKAAEVINTWVKHARGKMKNNVTETGRIVMRPDVGTWIMNLVQKSESISPMHARQYVAVAEAVGSLCPFNKDMAFDGLSATVVNDDLLNETYTPYAARVADHPWFLPLKLDLNTYERLCREGESSQALEMLAVAFALDAVPLARHFRRFIILAEGESYHEHITVMRHFGHVSVTNPDDWRKMVEKKYHQ